MTEHERQLADIESSGMSGPTKLAATCELMLRQLLAEREAETDPKVRKRLKQRIKTNRMLLKWAKTRAGFRP